MYLLFLSGVGNVPRDFSSWALFACGVGVSLSLCLLVRTQLLFPPLEARWLRFLRTYRDFLGKELIFLRASVGPAFVLSAQFLLIASGLILLKFHLYFGLGVVTLGLGISRFIAVLRRRRVRRLEQQVEGWLATLARALEAAPSLGEAVEVSAAMSDVPLRDELDVVVSQLHLGRPLDRALTAFGQRVGSRTLALALSTLQVGRATGGGLPDVLRSAAAALAELERLEGVVRTKTAEGKVQAWTISVIPLPVYFAVRASDPDYFAPLEHTGMGHILTTVAVCFWLVAIFSARKILAVRI